MEKNEVTKKIAAASFFVGGVGVLLLVILLIGQDKGLIEPKFQVRVFFKDVRGLSDAAPVRLSGVNVGNVASISFLNERIRSRRVQVVLNILAKYREQLLKGNPRFTIVSEGILGEKLIEINLIDGEAATDLNKPVMGEDVLDVRELAEVFARAAESFTKTSEQLSQIDLKGLSQSMQETSHSLSTSAESLGDLLSEMHHITRKSKRVLDRVEEKLIEGNLFKVF